MHAGIIRSILPWPVDGHHNVVEFFVQHGLYARDFIIRNVESELEENIVQVVEITYHFEAMIVLRGDSFELNVRKL